MKKVILIESALVLLLAGIMMLLLSQKEPRNDIMEPQVCKMFENVKGDVDISKADELRIRRIFGVNASDYELFVYYASEDSMNVREFLLIRADNTQLVSLQTVLEEHISARLTAFQNYGEEQTILLENAVIEQYGNYICLIVAEEPQEWLNAVKTLLEV